MALNLTQVNVQRSIFEAIRLVCVSEGYTPDVTVVTTQSNWDTALKAIVTAKGFAIEIFGSSSNQSKGAKKVPRITVHPSRIVPGDIGLDVHQGVTKRDPNDPSKYIKYTPPYDLFQASFDIHLVSDTGEQEAILNAILFQALGTRKFIPYVTDVVADQGQIFFIQEQEFYSTADLIEGDNEKITSFIVPDLMLGNEEQISIAPIKEIDINININDNETEMDNLHLE